MSEPSVVFLSGELFPARGKRTPDREDVRVALRDLGVLAAVDLPAVDDTPHSISWHLPSAAVEFCVLGTASGEVARIHDTGELSVKEVARHLSDRFTAAVYLGDEVAEWSEPSDLDDELSGFLAETSASEDSRPGLSVVVTRCPPEQVMSRVRTSAELWALTTDGWTVVVTDDPTYVLHRPSTWRDGDWPVIVLSAPSTMRLVDVLAGEEHTCPLYGRAPVVRTFDPSDVDAQWHTAIALLGAPHHRPDSHLPHVLDLPDFASVDREGLTHALDRPYDERYLGHVLAALRLPTVAADVFEGRRDTSGFERLTNEGLMGRIGRWARRNG